MNNQTKKRKRNTHIRDCWSPEVEPQLFSKNEEMQIVFRSSDGINSATIHLDLWHVRDMISDLRKAAQRIAEQRKREAEFALECVE